MYVKKKSDQNISYVQKLFQISPAGSEMIEHVVKCTVTKNLNCSYLLASVGIRSVRWCRYRTIPHVCVRPSGKRDQEYFFENMWQI